jgi:hypothetical protein
MTVLIEAVAGAKERVAALDLARDGDDVLQLGDVVRAQALGHAEMTHRAGRAVRRIAARTGNFGHGGHLASFC